MSIFKICFRNSCIVHHFNLIVSWLFPYNAEVFAWRRKRVIVVDDVAWVDHRIHVHVKTFIEVDFVVVGKI